MSALDALITAGAMTMTPMPYVTTNYGVPYIPYQWGPGLYLEGNKLVARTPLPSGTPVEGSELITETKELMPCFAATIPACPGHWKTNTLNWVFKGGEWCRKDLLSATNVVAPPEISVSTNGVQATNQLLSSIVLYSTWTNVWAPTPDARALRLEIEALEQQVKFWKGKAVGE